MIQRHTLLSAIHDGFRANPVVSLLAPRIHAAPLTAIPTLIGGSP